MPARKQPQRPVGRTAGAACPGDGTGLALWTYAPDRREMALAATAREALGLPGDRLPLEEYLGRVSKRGRNRLRAAFGRLDTGRGVDVVHEFRRDDGRVLMVRTMLQPVAPGHGPCLPGATQVLSTEGGEMLLPPEVYAALGQSTSDAIVLMDADAQILSFNPAAERMFGHCRDDVLGRPLDILLPPAVRGVHGRYFAEFLASPRSGRMMGNRPEMQAFAPTARNSPPKCRSRISASAARRSSPRSCATSRPAGSASATSSRHGRRRNWRRRRSRASSRR